MQRVYTWGSPKNPLLFFLHGWLDSGASFQFVCEQLEKKFYCVAPDMRGYGQSEHTKSPLGYFFYEYVADLHQLISKLARNQKIHLVGHSLGGAISSVYAGLYPDVLHSYVNIEGLGFQHAPMEASPDRIKKWLEEMAAKRFRSFRSKEDFATRLIETNPKLTLERARLLTPYLARQKKGQWTMAADAKHKMWEPYWFPIELFYVFWARIKCRALVILAEKTEMTKYYKGKNYQKIIQERLQNFPRETFEHTIPDCGHMIHLEKPEELATVISNFLL